MITGHNITVRYGNNTVLKDVSLNLTPGEFTAVLGPNGAGKSTLLHVLTGAKIPQEGSTALDDQPMAQIPANELACRRAVMPQTSRLNFNFTVQEVVEMGRLPHLKNREGETEDIVEAAMEKVDVNQLASRYYLTLSGGERQRVGLARAMAQVWPTGQGDQRLYLFLDEPTNNLDICHQHEIMAAARQMAKEGLGVCCVLHDLNLAQQYADRCAILSQGKLEYCGPTQEALDSQRLSSIFQITIQRLQSKGGSLLGHLAGTDTH